VSRHIWIEKQGPAMRLGNECVSAVVIIEQPAHFWDESPIRKAFLSTIQADPSCTPFFHDALEPFIDNELKYSIFVEVDILLSTGRSESPRSSPNNATFHAGFSNIHG
jgi:hypothetical protein